MRLFLSFSLLARFFNYLAPLPAENSHVTLVVSNGWNRLKLLGENRLSVQEWRSQIVNKQVNSGRFLVVKVGG
jgi:hypothetical protein